MSLGHGTRSMVGPTVTVTKNDDGEIVLHFMVPKSKFGPVEVVLLPNAAKRLGDKIDKLIADD